MKQWLTFTHGKDKSHWKVKQMSLPWPKRAPWKSWKEFSMFITI